MNSENMDLRLNNSDNSQNQSALPSFAEFRTPRYYTNQLGNNNAAGDIPIRDGGVPNNHILPSSATPHSIGADHRHSNEPTNHRLCQQQTYPPTYIPPPIPHVNHGASTCTCCRSQQPFVGDRREVFPSNHSANQQGLSYQMSGQNCNSSSVSNLVQLNDILKLENARLQSVLSEKDFIHQQEIQTMQSNHQTLITCLSKDHNAMQQYWHQSANKLQLELDSKTAVLKQFVEKEKKLEKFLRKFERENDKLTLNIDSLSKQFSITLPNTNNDNTEESPDNTDMEILEVIERELSKLKLAATNCKMMADDANKKQFGSIFKMVPVEVTTATPSGTNQVTKTAGKNDTGDSDNVVLKKNREAMYTSGSFSLRPPPLTRRPETFTPSGTTTQVKEKEPTSPKPPILEREEPLVQTLQVNPWKVVSIAESEDEDDGEFAACFGAQDSNTSNGVRCVTAVELESNSKEQTEDKQEKLPPIDTLSIAALKKRPRLTSRTKKVDKPTVPIQIIVDKNKNPDGTVDDEEQPGCSYRHPDLHKQQQKHQQQKEEGDEVEAQMDEILRVNYFLCECGRVLPTSARQHECYNAEDPTDFIECPLCRLECTGTIHEHLLQVHQINFHTPNDETNMI